jgi:hypothetical protein
MEIGEKGNLGLPFLAIQALKSSSFGRILELGCHKCCNAA